VSCVVPAFNSAAYLDAALDSIFAQTYRPIEVIVVDDGSTDGTLDLVRRRSRRINLLRQHNQGPAATRNLGLRAATGEYVAFLDADDLWLPEKLRKQMARFAARPDLAISVTQAQFFWDDQTIEESSRAASTARNGPVPGYATTTLLAPRRIFDRVGPLDATRWFSDATEWFVRAEELGFVIELLPEVLTLHRMHARNLTRRREAASRAEFLHLVKARLDRRRRA
jgi:glycosyltransferase involved in cell wall biosynthesis